MTKRELEKDINERLERAMKRGAQEKLLGDFISVDEQKSLIKWGIELGLMAGTMPVNMVEMSDKRLSAVHKMWQSNHGKGISV